MTDKTHRLSYSKADWDLIHARQEHKWAKMASDVTVIKPDGTTQIIKNNPKFVKPMKIGYKENRQNMFDGNHLNEER